MSETILYILIFAAIMFFMHRGHSHSRKDNNASADKGKEDQKLHHH